MMDGFTMGGKVVADSYQCRTILSFAMFMAAVVTQRRGGQNFDHIPECLDFMREVTRKPFRSVSDPLPDDYDWSAAGARDSAEAMLEYDA